MEEDIIAAITDDALGITILEDALPVAGVADDTLQVAFSEDVAALTILGS